MRDHGGDLDRAIATYGAGGWIDLSTGINRSPYPLPALPDRVWTDLPTRADMARLTAAAAGHFATPAPVVALAGAQAAIQLLPGLRPERRPGREMRFIAPSYNEYQAVFAAAGWQVRPVAELKDLAGADVAIVVNPNNPDGRHWSPDALLDLAGRVGLLVVDESFIEMTPAASLAPRAGQSGLLILRSFGKFFGLAGLRLGFALGDPALCATLAQAAGPWPVTGAAVEIGCRAFGDRDWIAAARQDLSACRAALVRIAPWPLAGACDLFALFEVGKAQAVQEALAAERIWTRRFPWSETLLRIGVPARGDLPRLEAAFARL